MEGGPLESATEGIRPEIQAEISANAQKDSISVGGEWVGRATIDVWVIFRWCYKLP